MHGVSRALTTYNWAVIGLASVKIVGWSPQCMKLFDMVIFLALLPFPITISFGEDWSSYLLTCTHTYTHTHSTHTERRKAEKEAVGQEDGR